jgi:hypothetical protein
MTFYILGLGLWCCWESNKQGADMAADDDCSIGLRGRCLVTGLPTVTDRTGWACRWSGVNRTERYKRRHGGEDSGLDADNPLPGVIDPVTLDPIVNPAMSPYGHVMGLATWRAVLAEQGKCPFTQQPLRPEQITVLTKANIERLRDRLILHNK